MCGGGNFYGGQQPGATKPMQANPFQDAGSAGGNMAYRQMGPSTLPPQGGRTRAPGFDFGNAGMSGGNMAPGGAPPGYTGMPPPPVTTNQGQAGGNMFDPRSAPNPLANQGQAGGNMYQPPQAPNPGTYGPSQAAFGGLGMPQAQQTWDPPGQKDFAPGGGFYPTTSPTQVPSVTAGWMGMGGQAPNPNMSYNPVTKQWGY